MPSKSPVIKRLDSQSADFQQTLEQLVQWESVSDKQVVETVESILSDVRERGDAAGREEVSQARQQGR